MDATIAQPKNTELFLASLVATALVYLTGIIVIAILVAATSAEDAFKNAFTFLGFFATIGVGAAMMAGFLIVAPLGTALGRLMLRLSPPGWWQGPATGVLVALTLVAVTLSLFAWGGQPMDPGLFAMAAIPIVLSPLAGAFVQQRVLKWPNPKTS